LKRFSSVYGGSKVLAQPLQQLIALGRSTYAIELYLKKRSAVLRTAARELIVNYFLIHKITKILKIPLNSKEYLAAFLIFFCFLDKRRTALICSASIRSVY